MSKPQEPKELHSILDSLEQQISQHYHRFVSDVKASAKHLLNNENADVSDSWHHANDSVNNQRRVVIHEIHYENEEWVAIKNQTLFPQLLSGWRLNAGNKGQDFVFPDSFVILPGATIKIHTQAGEKLSFDSKQSIWNNKGDTGYLFNGEGELISSYKYGNHAHNDLELCELFFDGEEIQTEGDEFVALRNRSDSILDISRWRINAGRDQEFNFPIGTKLPPNGIARVYTNLEVENQLSSIQHFSMKHPSAVWRNKGDIGYLYDDKDHRVFSWAYGDKLHDSVSISMLFNDGVQGRSESDEYIELVNKGIHIADISGWKIDAGNDVTFTFPANSFIYPDTKIRVYTNEVHPIYGGFSFNSKQAIWNNKGDVATVFDHQGKQVCRWAYGKKA